MGPNGLIGQWWVNVTHSDEDASEEHCPSPAPVHILADTFFLFASGHSSRDFRTTQLLSEGAIRTYLLHWPTEYSFQSVKY